MQIRIRSVNERRRRPINFHIPFVHNDVLNIAVRLEHGPYNVSTAIVVSHSENEEGTFFEAQNASDIHAGGFGSFCRDYLSVEIADLSSKMTNTL